MVSLLSSDHDISHYQILIKFFSASSNHLWHTNGCASWTSLYLPWCQVRIFRSYMCMHLLQEPNKIKPTGAVFWVSDDLYERICWFTTCVIQNLQMIWLCNTMTSKQWKCTTGRKAITQICGNPFLQWDHTYLHHQSVILSSIRHLSSIFIHHPPHSYSTIRTHITKCSTTKD